ncbi:MAG: hypothetical protein ACRDSJ_16615 [Rubrobacteraceae bacterium]
MNIRITTLLAWSLCLLGIALNLAVGGVLLIGDLPVERANPWGTTIGGLFVFPVAILAFGLVGVLLVSRLPRNPVGWICLFIGLNLMFYLAADLLAYPLMARPGSLPTGEYMAWFVNWLWVPAVGLLGTFLVLLFPNGRLPTRRWRPVAWISGAVLVLYTPSLAFFPGPLIETPDVINPVGIEPARSALVATIGVLDVLLPLCFVASAASMIVRFRCSVGEERQQLKWFASAAALLAVSFPLVIVFYSGPIEDFMTLIFASLPIAVGIAVLRHRLYDIDVIINRTLVYGSLTLLLAGTYLGSVVFLQYVFRSLSGQDSQIVIVASTLVIAALFVPLRRRIQSFVDRRFYRRKYDAARTLGEFSKRLRDETDLENLSEDLVSVVRETVQPAHASLWLKRPDGGAKR